MCDLIRGTFTDATAFWGMVEALGTVVAATVTIVAGGAIFYQVRRLREESSAHKAAGYDWLVTNISSGRFKENVDTLREEVDMGGTDAAFSALIVILADVAVLLELIEEKFVTVKMLQATAGSLFLTISSRIVRLLDWEATNKRTTRIISYRLEAHQLINRMAELAVDKAEEAREWREVQDE